MILEIELKYSLDEALAREIRSRKQLGPCSLTAFHIEMIHDDYYDTPDQRLLQAGYALRYRQRETGGVLQLKSQSPATDALHRRREMHLPTTTPTRPQNWPDGPEKTFLLSLLQDEPLVELFRVRQKRHIAAVLDDSGLPFASLSLDEVHWQVGVGEEVGWELEIELLPEGDEARLHLLAQALDAMPALHLQPLSKYERGLILMSSLQNGGR